MSCIKESMMERKENVYSVVLQLRCQARAEKTARNISKNITITIPAHKFPAFKPAKSFIDRMRDLGEVE